MNRLLIVDDDMALAATLAETLERHGFALRHAASADDGYRLAQEWRPGGVLLDLKMPGGSGLELIPRLMALAPPPRIVVLTGYASIPTAVEAIKLGAIHYLAKPVSSAEIVAAFGRETGDPAAPIEPAPLTLSLAEREHILATLERHGRNVSAAARDLGLHRRTLQRKLEKMRL